MGQPLAPSRPVLAAAQRLRIDVVTADIVTRLRDAGIPSVVLKGASTARWLYEPSDGRIYSDADILIPPPLRAAEPVLEASGFKRNRPAAVHAMSWERASDVASVDLHHSFYGVGVDDATAWAVLAYHTEPMEIGGIEVAVLDLPARALIVALHAAAGNRRNRVVRDLQRALDRLPTELWIGASRLAVELDAAVPFAAGLRSLPAGRKLSSELGLPEISTTWVRRSGADRQVLGIALWLEWIALLPTTRAKVRFVARSLFPEPAIVRNWMIRNPGGSQWVPLGYGRRIASKARTAPRAISRWRRVRDDAG